MHGTHLCLATFPHLTISPTTAIPNKFTLCLTANVSARCTSPHFSIGKQPWKAYQEACFHSLEHATLHVCTHHCVLVDHGEAVAHRHCLLQPVAPAQSALLDGLELPLVHRQHTSQLSLQNNRCFEMSGRKKGIVYTCFTLCGTWQQYIQDYHVLMTAALSFRQEQSRRPMIA